MTIVVAIICLVNSILVGIACHRCLLCHYKCTFDRFTYKIILTYSVLILFFTFHVQNQPS